MKLIHLSIKTYLELPVRNNYSTREIFLRQTVRRSGGSIATVLFLWKGKNYVCLDLDVRRHNFH